MNIHGASGFDHFTIKYVWRCRACGCEHSVEYRHQPGTAMRMPTTPEGWLIVTVNRTAFPVSSTYCPLHRVVVQDGVTNVHAKEETGA